MILFSRSCGVSFFSPGWAFCDAVDEGGAGLLSFAIAEADEVLQAVNTGVKDKPLACGSQER
ncbi:hypothetical protein Mapa_012424 [Marchantia paleacea]|nr:hypothetical protein Mapa_012424 [Marchantia paleacea]